MYQGTYIDSQHTQVDRLIANIRNTELPLEKQREQLDLVAALNAKHLKDRNDDPQLEARIRTFELAFRMQSEAADVFDLSRETKKVREWYGETTHRPPVTSHTTAHRTRRARGATLERGRAAVGQPR